MAIDRRGTGLFVLRVCAGTFILAGGLLKVRWFTDPSILAGQLATWHGAVAPGSISADYLERFAIPYVRVFARLVPLGEITCGAAMILGFWTWIFALVSFLMILNFHIASGTIFHAAFLTNPYGLPMIGGTLALAFGGVRLPLSLRG
jgi:uncharacterized membrane protein YphA (DoxX/SURF4 family)